MYIFHSFTFSKYKSCNMSLIGGACDILQECQIFAHQSFFSYLFMSWNWQHFKKSEIFLWEFRDPLPFDLDGPNCTLVEFLNCTAVDWITVMQDVFFHNLRTFWNNRNSKVLAGLRPAQIQNILIRRHYYVRFSRLPFGKIF